MEKTWKEALQKLLRCDIKSLYPLARSLNRKLYFYVGPTNSGKTYTAIRTLKESHCGIYLAPLRLLALEVYEILRKEEIPASLITGEEQIFDEAAAHVCSTIEMVDFDLDIDICVIDEVQMLDDVERGWAWINAIIGVPAKKVIMTGSVNALEAIKKIASYLDEELEVVKFKRKNELKILSQATPLKEIKKGTALIAFSRNDVLKYKQKLQKFHKVSVIYGNLSPEVRRDEAKRFREGQSDVLIATDAIAMGLNLPIQTILFTTHTKFDGVSKRLIISNEIVQIAGRAGRFGHHEEGFIGGTSTKVLEHIKKEFHSPIKTIKHPFKVKANAQQIEALSGHLQTKNLTKVLQYFAKNMIFSGPFVAVNISSMISTAKIVDTKFNLTLTHKYMLSQAPVSIKSMLIKQAFEVYINAIVKNRVIRYKASITLPKRVISQKDLLQIEDEVKKITLYLWLSYKMPELFPDKEKARMKRDALNKFIEKSLKNSISMNVPDKSSFKKKNRFNS